MCNSYVVEYVDMSDNVLEPSKDIIANNPSEAAEKYLADSSKDKDGCLKVYTHFGAYFQFEIRFDCSMG